MSEKDRKKGNVAKENGNVLEGEGENDCIEFYQYYSGCSVQNLSLLLIAVIIWAQKFSPKVIHFHAYKEKWMEKKTWVM